MDFVDINKKRRVGGISNLRLVDGKFPFPFKLGSNQPLQPLMHCRVVLVGWLVGFVINVDILKFTVKFFFPLSAHNHKPSNV